MSTNEGQNFEANIEEFAKRHYVKLFRKKYKNAWDITEIAIIQEAKRIDRLVGLTDKAETIKSCFNKSIIKLNFKIAGTNESAKSSGNRAIVFVDYNLRLCNILLVYSKNEICQPNETGKWQEIIKRNYSEIWSNFDR